MKLFSHALKRVRQVSGKNLFVLFAVFLVLSIGGAMGVSTFTQSDKVDAACAGDPTGNAIIRCGEPNRAAFIAKVKSSPELQKIYAKFGLNAGDYSRFVNSAVPGVAYRSDNTIKVNGRTVATGVWSIGRYKSYQGSNPMTVVIPGAGTYYGNYNNQAFASSSATIPVDVLFDAQGKMQFAVMTSDCANPAKGTPTSPSYACHSLQSTSLGNNSYRFTADADAANGAKITKVVYDFGDGSADAVKSSPSEAVTHTFTKSTTVTVKIYVSLPGGGQVVLINCKKAITFTPPPAVFACTLLSKTPGKIDAAGNQAYVLTASASAKNATIKSYNFTFDTGSKATVVTTANKSTAVGHVYAPGTHNATVSVTFVTNTGVTKTVTAASCATQIVVKTPDCKPGVPAGSPKCSTLACVSLTATPGAIDKTTGNQTYSFTAKATADQATITNYGFAFGDGVVVNTGSGLTATTTHTFKPNTYTANVIVSGKDAAGRTLQAPVNVNCAKQITVTAPECKPGVPTTSSECFTYTCDQLTVTQGDNRTVTIGAFKATTTNPNAILKTVTVDWGDNTSDQPTSDKVVGTTHVFNADQGYTITATAHFAASDNADIAVTGPACVQTVSFTTTPPPVVPPVTPPVETPPTELVNTGAGSVIGIFAGAVAISTVAYRLFIGRRLSRQA